MKTIKSKTLMLKTSDFNFINQGNKKTRLELPFSEHLEELRQRLIYTFWYVLFTTIFSFIQVKNLVRIIEFPAKTVTFFQLSPGEYFISTAKIAFCNGILFGTPFLISQLTFFLIPGLTDDENEIILPLLTGSWCLFGTGVIFSYKILLPAALAFFLNYSDNIIEPLWSFDQYFEFVLVLFYTTGFAFQIPVIQILAGCLNLVSYKQMLNKWRYIALGSTIIGAILTPSTDPLTQLLLAAAIFFLYLLGIGIVFLIKK